MLSAQHSTPHAPHLMLINQVQCIRLNMPDSEYSRLMSGLDTRSVSLNGYVNTTGTLASDPNLMIFAECTSCLRVGAGRQLEIII